ncbi:MAG: hypothetical protein ACRDD7_15625 [Peptostreptococcaceae bacterium]
MKKLISKVHEDWVMYLMVLIMAVGILSTFSEIKAKDNEIKELYVLLQSKDDTIIDIQSTIKMMEDEINIAYNKVDALQEVLDGK